MKIIHGDGYSQQELESFRVSQHEWLLPDMLVTTEALTFAWEETPFLYMIMYNCRS